MCTHTWLRVIFMFEYFASRISKMLVTKANLCWRLPVLHRQVAVEIQVVLLRQSKVK